MAKQTRVQRLKIKRAAKYSLSLAKKICEEIACSDKSIKIICKETPSFPNHKIIFKWIAQYPDFEKLYLRAKQLQILFLTDEIHQIAADYSKDVILTEDSKKFINNTAVNRSRVRIDTIKWAAAKLMPRLFGDRIVHSTETDDKNKIPTIAIVPAEQTIEEWTANNLDSSSRSADETIDMSNS